MMEKELQGKLVEILTSIQDGVGQAKDFALGQLPDIAQSYIAYGRALSVVTALLCLLFVAGGVWVLGAGRRAVTSSKDAYAKEHNGERPRHSFDYYDGFPHFMGGSMLCAAGAVVFAVNLSGLLLVWLAPKVWLLKQLASFIR